MTYTLCGNGYLMNQILGGHTPEAERLLADVGGWHRPLA